MQTGGFKAYEMIIKWLPCWIPSGTRYSWPGVATQTQALPPCWVAHFKLAPFLDTLVRPAA